MPSISLTGDSRFRQEADPTPSNFFSFIGFVKVSSYVGVTDRLLLINNLTVLDVVNTGNLRLRSTGATVFSNIETGAGTFILNTLYCICGTFNVLTNEVRFKVNNVDNNTVLIDSTITASSISNSPTGYHLGETGGTVGPTANYSNWRLYNKILSVSEINTISTLRGLDGNYGNLLLRWVFDENYPGQNVTNGRVKNLANYINNTTITGINTPTFSENRMPSGNRRRRAR